MKLYDKRNHGYPAMAQLMGPHAGMTIFKKFSILSSHDVLLRQAELLQLERKLHITGMIDQQAGLEYSEKANDLFDSKEHGFDHDQLDLVTTIRERLKEYHEALLRQAQIAQLPEARPYDVTQLREWLKRKKGGNNFLKGVEDLPYLEGEEDDLVSTSERGFDSITTCIAESVVPWLFRTGASKRQPVTGQEELGLVRWSDNTYRRSAKGLSVVTATIIPTLAIVVLYFIHNLIARILAAMGMSFAFSLILALLTSASSAEIFGSTVAFAAIQVVFIGSTSLGHQSNAS